MRSGRSDRSISRSGPIAVLASNLLTPIGVLALGWSTTVLLGVFALDVIAGVWWAIPKIPFAAKRPNNALDDDSRLFGPFQTARGAIALPGPFPPVYLRNLPTLVVTACVLAPLETVVAFVVFALPDPTITDAVAGQLLLGGLAVVAGRGYETWADYFRGGGYRDHSPRSVLLGPFMHLFAVGALVFVAGGSRGRASPATPCSDSSSWASLRSTSGRSRSSATPSGAGGSTGSTGAPRRRSTPNRSRCRMATRSRPCGRLVASPSPTRRSAGSRTRCRARCSWRGAASASSPASGRGR
ncbi:DUF6498-containing protein [Halobaculum halobium]|uniref:DUF6498-containing protein n=1 Tax=Halobaculum halobium TaxID=3032281 RepID=UPI003623A8AB